MDPNSKVELPPRGADLSFLNNGSGGADDTPSRWLTFGNTPNGNTTPGTAFGSPFWASLGQAKSSPTAKTYSPSKELNPFELSFFPKSDTLAGSSSTQGAAPKATGGGEEKQQLQSAQPDQQTQAGVKLEEKDEAETFPNGQSTKNPLTSSVKRPFQDIASNDGAPGFASQPSTAGNAPSEALPSWKRPKFTTESSESNDGSSPHMGPGGPTPESGSPASSMVPTPNFTGSIFPLSNRSSIGGGNGAEMPDSLLNEPSKGAHQQVDVRDALQRQSSDVHVPTSSRGGQPAAHTSTFPITQSIPNPITSPFPPHAANASTSQAPHPPNFYGGYNPYLQHHPAAHPFPHHQHAQQQVGGPVILPPKHAAPLQRGQSSVQRVPDSASESGQHAGAIPYANGRAPSMQPSARKASTTSLAMSNKTKSAPSEADMSENDSSVANSSVGKTVKISDLKTKKGKKGDEKRKVAGSTSANAKNATSAPASTSMDGDGEEPFDDDGDEGKRKAFLERNRQAACRSRQKKKEWIGNLEHHAAQLQQQNSVLTQEIDQLRKEMFALRHTLSFHERCGCPSVQDWMVRERGHSHPVPPGMHGNVHPQAAHLHPQAPLPPAAASSKTGAAAPPPLTAPTASTLPSAPGPATHISPHSQHVQPQPRLQHASSSLHSGHFQGQASTPSMASLTSGSPASNPSPESAIPPMSAVAVPLSSIPAGVASHVANFAPSPLATRPALQQQQPNTQASSVQQSNAPGRLSFIDLPSAPQHMQSQHHQQMQHQQQQHAQNGHEILRPGSAGASFGLSTPNFSDLFNGAMARFAGNTPGGAFGNVNLSPALPNTFGLSLKDIPVRPASAPPTPSPAINPAHFAPGNDSYFTAKTGGTGTPGIFGDLLLQSMTQGMGVPGGPISSHSRMVV